MAAEPLRVYGPAQPGTTDAIIYTAPRATWFTSIWVGNTTGATAWVRLDLNSTGVAQRILPDVNLPPNTVGLCTGRFFLDTGETLRARQGSAGAITMAIMGERA